MNTEEYLEKMKEIQKEIDRIQMDYAFSNKKCNVGDIIKKQNISIIVDEIRWLRGNPAFNSGFPYCVYIGRLLTKGNKPRKDGSTFQIYNYELPGQCSVISQ